MLLDEDQRDALTEVCNIGMGRAGDALSQLLDTFVALSTPRVRIVRAGESDLGLRAPGAAQDAERVTAVRQSFFVDLQGETITVFGISGATSGSSWVPGPGRPRARTRRSWTRPRSSWAP